MYYFRLRLAPPPPPSAILTLILLISADHPKICIVYLRAVVQRKLVSHKVLFCPSALLHGYSIHYDKCVKIRQKLQLIIST